MRPYGWTRTLDLRSDMLPYGAGLEDLEAMIVFGRPRFLIGWGPEKKRLMICFVFDGGLRTSDPLESLGAG